LDIRDESIVTVDADGVATGISPGVAKVHAKNSEGFERYINVKVVSKEELELAVDLTVDELAELEFMEWWIIMAWSRPYHRAYVKYRQKQTVRHRAFS